MNTKGFYEIFDPSGNRRSLYVERYGQGAPTVVIETGSTMPGAADPGWAPLRKALARETSVFLYDRANLGRSDPAPLPRTLDDFAADLHDLLGAAQVPPPYLLVGCSLGGMIVTHYASLHPQGVCGLLLLDPPHPRVNLSTLALLPPEMPGEPPSLADFRRLAWMEQHALLEADESEGLDYPASIAQAEAAWNLRDIPLVVLTAGVNEYGEGFPVETARAYEDLWLELQKAYAALSTRSEHILVEDSDHVIHDRRPELVLEKIRQMLVQGGKGRSRLRLLGETVSRATRNGFTQ